MTTTTVAFGDAKAQKKWSAQLANDINTESYFTKFTGEGENNIIQRKTELENDAGDRVSFDLAVRLRQAPTYGDARQEGKEEALRFFTDEVNIDQVRHSVSAGGRMSRKRTAHDLRKVAKAKLAGYFAQYLDEVMFMYLSGARGVNQDYIESTSFAGFASNSFQAPDSEHIVYGAVGAAKATITTSDKMTAAVIERTANKATMMQARNPATANMVPVKVEGADRYVLLMSEDQGYDLRNADTNGWAKYQAAAAAAEGSRTNAIFKGGLGMINNVVLHTHRNVVRFSDYGAGGNLPAARALFMGRQAAVVAYGTTGGLRYMWEEKEKDFNNEPAVCSGFIGGVKKTRFNSMDFGVIAVDTYAKDPNV